MDEVSIRCRKTIDKVLKSSVVDWMEPLGDMLYWAADIRASVYLYVLTHRPVAGKSLLVFCVAQLGNLVRLSHMDGGVGRSGQVQFVER